MYCLLKNTCKYEYKCCNYCKQNCEYRCMDCVNNCKFFCKVEPQPVYRFNRSTQTQPKQDIVIKEIKIKQTQINKPIIKKVSTHQKADFKPKKKKTLI